MIEAGFESMISAVCFAIIGTASLCSFAFAYISRRAERKAQEVRKIASEVKVETQKIEQQIATASDDALADLGNELLQKLGSSSGDQKE